MGGGRAADGIPGGRVVSAGAARHPGMPCALAASHAMTRSECATNDGSVTSKTVVPRNPFLYIFLFLVVIFLER